MKPRHARPIALLLLLLLYTQTVYAAVHLSATVDEGFHITSGYEYLRRGTLHLFDEHPPLAKALFAWPLFFVPDLTPPDIAVDYASSNLITVTQATTLAYRPLDRVIVAPRLAAILVSVLFAATLYRCAVALNTPVAGLLALGLSAFDPNFLAHASLATTDMGATAFSFCALWAGERWLRRPSFRRWWCAGLFLGLAQGTKLTALLLYVVLGISVLARTGTRRRDRHWFRPLIAYAGMMGLSLLILWALYGFELRPLPGILGGIPIPAASHLERWFRLRQNLAYGRESFLLGQNSMHGWPLYFPIAFLVKTPLPLLILTGVSMLTAGISRARGRRAGTSHLAFWLFPLLYGLASLTSTLNIGYRHLLPILPFLYLGIGAEFHNRVIRIEAPDLRRLHHATTYALCLWLILSTLQSSPHYLAFFNELTGGPDSGWRFLADSNTDWGQTFKALAEYQERYALGTVRLSTFIFYDPSAYGVDYTPLAAMTGAPVVLPQRFNPEPGIYALSATTLDGVPLAYPPTFYWFRHRQPFAKIGHVMFLYNVRPLSGTWLAQCTVPVIPLPDTAIDEGFGIPNLRRVVFDCEQSWVIPNAGTTPGWITRAIPEQTRLRWPSADIESELTLPAWANSLPLEGLTLSYLQPRHGELSAFAVWECDACRLSTPQAPVALGETMAYLGIQSPASAPPGTSLEVLTFWEVLTPPGRPLSIMLHLRGADGAPIAVGDGLGFPVEGWQTGDRIVQRHQITIPAEASAGQYWLYTGAYWLDDLNPLFPDAFTAPLSVK